MSGQADGGGADGFERRHKTRDDPWMSTVTNVSGFLAGFGLATVVVIAGGPGNFRWPGAAVLALTIASVALIVAAQESRQGAYYYEKSTKRARQLIWILYHVGIIALLAGLGAALAPDGGTGTQVSLRCVAMWGAFLAVFVEVLLMIPAAAKVIRRLAMRVTGISDGNYEKLTGLLRDRQAWRPGEQDGERFWCFEVDGAARLLIVPERGGFLMYRADEDRCWVIRGIESVGEWLDQNEAEHAGPRALRVEFRKALERAREQWRGQGGQADA